MQGRVCDKTQGKWRWRVGGSQLCARRQQQWQHQWSDLGRGRWLPCRGGRQEHWPARLATVRAGLPAREPASVAALASFVVGVCHTPMRLGLVSVLHKALLFYSCMDCRTWFFFRAVPGPSPRQFSVAPRLRGSMQAPPLSRCMHYIAWCSGSLERLDGGPHGQRT